VIRILGQQIPIDSISDAVDTSNVTTWDFVWAATSVVVGVILSRIARATVRRYGQRASLPPNMTDLLGTIVMWMVVAVSVVFALTFVGLDVAPLWILIVLILVGFAVGGRSLLESFGAGILLQARSPFEPGDLVKLGAESGIVHEVNSRVVVIDTLDGRRVFVPNSTVIAEPIVNLTHRPIRMAELGLDVVYATDLDLASASPSARSLASSRSRPIPHRLRRWRHSVTTPSGSRSGSGMHRDNSRSGRRRTLRLAPYTPRIEAMASSSPSPNGRCGGETALRQMATDHQRGTGRVA